MRPTTNKILALLGSLLFHFLIVGGFIYLQIQSEQYSKWSGGNGQGYQPVVYITITEGEKSPDSKVATAKSKAKKSVKIKTAKELKGKPKKRNQMAKQKKAKTQKSGTGDSDTPAGGRGPGLDPDGVISQSAPNILALIRKKIMRKKKYPSIAKENNWTGRVKLNFKINESGGLDFVKLMKSSGYDVLDTSAMNTIKQALPLPFYPKVIGLSLEYRLEK